MPTVVVHTLELTEDQKTFLAQNYTDLLSKTLGMPVDKIYVLFNGYSLDSLSVGGHLISEHPPGPYSWNSKYTAELREKLEAAGIEEKVGTEDTR